MNKSYLFTSESVTEGHPDKIADQISDGVLDAVLKEDPNGRVACECFLTTGMVFIGGEITTAAYVDIPTITRGIIKDIGYSRGEYGLDWNTCAVISSINQQSPDIAMGVDTGGAGDQGLMFGYACNETPTLMPFPISMAHGLTMRLSELRKSGELPYLRPDGKSQVSVWYENGIPKKVKAVVLAAQHNEDVHQSKLAKDLEEKVVRQIIPADMLDDDVELHINNTGRFVIGGPQGDAGLTGRKIIVDTYGGMGRHGGGAFSGKDPSKVDRSASYMARYIAKNIVAAGLADKVEIQLSYVIGRADPVSISFQTFETGKVSEEKLLNAVRDIFPLTPKGIIDHLDLLRPIFRKTASYGHFGRELPEFTWEKTDKAEELAGLCR